MTSDKQEKARPKNIHESIELMTELLSKVGIEKKQGNTSAIKYAFRGIDDIRNTIAPLQKQCALNIIPRMIERVENDTRLTSNKGFSMWVVAKMEFDFINTIDESKITVPQQGEAVDYSDKATQKAVSQAYKIACINVFNIPTEGEQDTDNEAIKIAAKMVGEFESDALRQMYIENCKGAFEKTETLAALKDIESYYHDKLVMMRNSSVKEDVEAGNLLAMAYKAKHDSFIQPKAKL